jgi:hypothetical protein
VSVNSSRSLWLVCLALGLLAAVVGAQALAMVSAPGGTTVQTGTMLGQTGFEYLGGLRKFGAAVLWNRLDPQFHEYDVGGSIDKRIDFLPTMRLVQLLDPQFEQSYYVSAFMLARNNRMQKGLEVAREGVAKNPNAGLMRASYAQLLVMQDKVKNLPEALKQAEAGAGPGATWANVDDKFEGYGIFRNVFRLAGDTVEAARMTTEQQAMKAQGAGLGVERDE